MFSIAKNAKDIENKKNAKDIENNVKTMIKQSMS